MKESVDSRMQKFMEGALSEEEVVQLRSELGQDAAEFEEAARYYGVHCLLKAQKPGDAFCDRVMESIASAREVDRNRIVEARVMRKVTSRPVQGKVRPMNQRRGPVYSWLALAATLLMAAGLGFWVTRAREGVVVAKVIEVQGAAVIARGGSELSIQVGMAVRDRDEIRTAKDARVLFQYEGESTSVHADGDVRLAVAMEQGAKRLHLANGLVDCEVAPQLQGHPMILETSGARMTVLGTELSVRTRGADTRMDVYKGTVQFLRKADQAMVTVQGGQYVSDAKGRKLEVALMPVDDVEGRGPSPARDSRRGKLVLEETFDKVKVGELPKGWTKEGGKKSGSWAVVKHDEQHVLEGDGDGRVLWGDGAWKNIEVQFDFRVDKDGADEIMFLYRRDKKGKSCGISVLPQIEENIRAAKTGWDKWHRVEIVCRNDKVSIWINGKIGMMDSKTFTTTPGGSGFLVRSGAALIDNVRVWELDE